MSSNEKKQDCHVTYMRPQSRQSPFEYHNFVLFLPRAQRHSDKQFCETSPTHCLTKITSISTSPRI